MPRVSPRAQSRLWITALVFLMVQAITFGVPTILTLAFAEEAAEWLLPAIVVLSVPISAVLSWQLAPRLRARFERQSNRAHELESEIVPG